MTNSMLITHQRLVRNASSRGDQTGLSTQGRYIWEV